MTWSWWPAFAEGASTRAPDAYGAAGVPDRQPAITDLTSARAKRAVAGATPTISLVEQTTRYNCGAAALAMILGLSSPEQVERDYLGRTPASAMRTAALRPGKSASSWMRFSECYLKWAFRPCLTSIVYAARRMALGCVVYGTAFAWQITAFYKTIWPTAG